MSTIGTTIAIFAGLFVVAACGMAVAMTACFYETDAKAASLRILRSRIIRQLGYGIEPPSIAEDQAVNELLKDTGAGTQFAREDIRRTVLTLEGIEVSPRLLECTNRQARFVESRMIERVTKAALGTGSTTFLARIWWLIVLRESIRTYLIGFRHLRGMIKHFLHRTQRRMGTATTASLILGVGTWYFARTTTPSWMEYVSVIAIVVPVSVILFSLLEAVRVSMDSLTPDRPQLNRRGKAIMVAYALMCVAAVMAVEQGIPARAVATIGEPRIPEALGTLLGAVLLTGYLVVAVKRTWIICQQDHLRHSDRVQSLMVSLFGTLMIMVALWAGARAVLKNVGRGSALSGGIPIWLVQLVLFSLVACTFSMACAYFCEHRQRLRRLPEAMTRGLRGTFRWWITPATLVAAPTLAAILDFWKGAPPAIQLNLSILMLLLTLLTTPIVLWQLIAARSYWSRVIAAYRYAKTGNEAMLERFSRRLVRALIPWRIQQSARTAEVDRLDPPRPG